MSARSFMRFAAIFALFALGLGGARAGDAATAGAMRLLKSNCFSCHNEEKKKGGLVMTSREALLKGGDDGAALDLKTPEKSGLLDALAPDADPHMPPKKQLTPAQIDALRNWIAQGAKWDATALVNAPSAPRQVALQAPPASYHPILAMALSPDASRLAVGCGNEVVLYDVTGKAPVQIARASAHPDPVQAIAWSPDGKQLATGAFRRVVLWSAEPLTKQWESTAGLTDRIAAIRFLPDNSRIVAADGRVDEAGTVRMLDAGTGAITASWQAHSDTVFDLAVSPDGKLLATAGGDKLVKLWDLESHKEMARLEGHAAQVLTVAFNADATQLLSGGADFQLKVWDVKTREKINTLGLHTTAVDAVAWPSSGAVFAVSDTNLLRYTDLVSVTGAPNGESAKESKLGTANAALQCLAASADGAHIFAGSCEGRLYAWNKDGKETANIAVNEAKATPETSPSFMRDVLPVLSKAGCNAGACHAKPDGQNGFKLTVFSFDPKSDYRSIVQNARSRRVFPSSPDESLILLKATNTIPHEGGERFDRNSEAYRTVKRWIEAGMAFRGANEAALERIAVEPAAHLYQKGASQQLHVAAIYADGSQRDVTALAGFSSTDKEIARVTDDGAVSIGKTSGQAVIVARFMGLVAASQIEVAADHLLPESKYAGLPVQNFIDTLAYAQFKRLGLFPSEGCTDAEFLRRASIDTIGALPTADEARTFLADTDPQKRDKLIDRLLDHPFYADYWANKWADLLRPNSDRVGIKSTYILDQWLRESFRENKPYDQFAREILTTEGNTHRYGPAVIYRDRREPQDLTTLFSQVFLGVKLDCARCHHHPNEKWGQDDFYQFAAIFGTVHQKGQGISAPISPGNETFYFLPGRTVRHPVTGELMEPRPPDGTGFAVEKNVDPRQTLADWLTDPKNPFFAKAVANRLWGAFFGRGIVDPVDDFRVSNPASNPELLDALGQELIRDKFNLKALMRTILQSHLYQLSSVPNEFNKADLRNFSRSYRRRLQAETLADAVDDITGLPTTYSGMPPRSRAMQAWCFKIESPTMDAFSRPNSSTDCPCERDVHPSIVQALHLMNSRLLEEKLASTDPAGRVQHLASSALTPEEIVTDLYLACYSRPPSAEESKLAVAAFSAGGATRRSATENVLWSLLNSAEFVFNH